MDLLLNELKQLSKSTKILQPDQTLQNFLIPLRTFLSSDDLNLNSEQLKEIESILLQLLKINKGNLGVACSLEIGHNLYLIYKHDPNKHFWNLISDVTKSPTEANICAIKFVISALGMYNKSSLNQIVQILVSSKKQKLHYSSLLALYSCFKACPRSFPKLVNSAFNFAKLCASNNSERVQIAAIHLLQVLISEPETNIKKVLLIVQQIFAENRSKFVEYAAANLVAQCAINPFLNEINEKNDEEDDKMPNQISEFHIGPLPKEHILAKSFEILIMFKPQFSLIFSLFLDKMPPYLIYLNVELLFNFAIKYSVKDVAHLATFFGQDVRSLFFTAVKSQKNVNFSLLCGLVYNNNSAKEAAGVAHDKIWSNNLEERKEAKKFFISLSNIFPNAALESLHVALHYIAMPPDDSPTMKMEYSGQATIASILLSTLKDNCESELPLLKKYIKLTLSENSENNFFLELLFMILNTQTDDFISEFNIQEILDRITNLYASKIPSDFANYPIHLIENMLIFYANHQNFQNIQKFSEFCFQIASHFSNSALIELIHVFHNLEISESFAYSMGTFLLNKSLSLNLSLKQIKKRVPELMKIPDELFFKEPKMQKDKNEKIYNFYCTNNMILNSQIIDFMPLLIKKMNVKNANTIINSAIQNTSQCSGHMIILSILQESENDSSLLTKIPPNIHISLTKTTNNEFDEIKLQITSECIATYIKYYPNEMPSLFPYLRQESIASCFIETALSRVVKMAEDNIAYIIVQSSNRLKNESLAIYVLHELSTIYAIKSIQLMNMMIGEQQCQQLLTLVTGKDVPIFTMYYASLCFEKLIPILIPTLHEKPTMNMILVFLNELWNSSIKFYKKLFYDSFRAIFAFSKEVADFFEIKPPQSSMIIDAQLSALGAIADIARAKPFASSMLDQLPPFFVLLQRTRDKRVSNFLLSAVNSYCENAVSSSSSSTLDDENVKELKKWFGLTHQLLSANSMVGFDEVNVEPNTCVKQTALSILKLLMTPLSKTEPFLAECLDDVMTSAIRSIESKKEDLYKTSYEILGESLKLFKSFKTDQNVKLLSLYESQYINAIRSAFPSSLDVSYSFLVEYIDFAFEQYKTNANDREACKQLIISLVSYVDKIKDKEKVTTGYYAIVTKIAVISEKYNEIFESICKEFLLKQVPHLRSLMMESIKLRSMSRKDEWHRITEFRMEFSPFYSNFLSSYIWLQKKFPPNKDDIKIQSLIEFFISEASAPEIWRICAAFGAMSAVINFFGDEIENNEFESILSTCGKVYKSNRSNILPMMPSFLLYTTRCASKPSMSNLPIWPQLTSLVLSSKCYPETIGLILKNANEEVLISKNESNELTLSGQILDFALKEFKEGLVNDDEMTAIATILYFKCPTMISSFVDRFFENENEFQSHPKFIATMLERATSHLIKESNSNSFPSLCNESTVSKISAFLLSELKNKKEEALKTAAIIAVRFPMTGSIIMKNGIIEEAINNYEGIDAFTLLNFYDLILSNIDHSQKVSESIAVAAANLIINFGNDRVSGLKITSRAVKIIKKCSSFISSAPEDAFEFLAEAKRTELMRILQKYSKKNTVKKISLRKFTNNTNYKRNTGSENVWQNLDDDSD